MLDELFAYPVARCAVVSECLQDSIASEIYEQPLAFGCAICRIVPETLFGVAEITALLVDVVLCDFVLCGGLCKHEHRG